MAEDIPPALHSQGLSEGRGILQQLDRLRELLGISEKKAPLGLQAMLPSHRTIGMGQDRSSRYPRLHHDNRKTLIERGLAEGERRRVSVEFVLLGEKTEIQDIVVAVRGDRHRAFTNQDQSQIS